MQRERRRRILRLLAIALLMDPLRAPGHWHYDPARPTTLQELFDMFSDDIFLQLHRFTKEQVVYMLPRLHLEGTIKIEG